MSLPSPTLEFASSQERSSRMLPVARANTRIARSVAQANRVSIESDLGKWRREFRKLTPIQIQNSLEKLEKYLARKADVS